MGCRQRVHGLATGADRQEKGAEDGWERGNLTTEGALPYRRISNAAKRFSPKSPYVNSEECSLVEVLTFLPSSSKA